MRISLVGDMIDVSDEELKAIGYSICGEVDMQVVRQDCILYIKEVYQEQVNADVEIYRNEQRQANAASLRAEAAELNRQADMLDIPQPEIPEDQ